MTGDSITLTLRYIMDNVVGFLVVLWEWIQFAVIYIWSYVTNGTYRGSAGIGTVVTFDNGRKVRIMKQIGEGGFSIIYSARECTSSLSSGGSNNSTLLPISTPFDGNRNVASFALKRILCPDKQTIRKCRDEANLHKSFHQENLMPLLGLKFDENCRFGEYEGMACYMLFPLMQCSLRDQITERNLLSDDSRELRPWKEREILEVFEGIVKGVHTMHKAGYAHRDVKVENILMDQRNRPVLMDFGSAGPVTLQIETRANLMSLVDEAASNSTISFRAPELFEGGARRGEPDIDGRVDVWSLGCVLFAMMFGASPFECEFRGEFVRIVECSHLRVLGRIPSPPPNTEVASRYSEELYGVVVWLLTQDRVKRPTISHVQDRVEALLVQRGGIRGRSTEAMGEGGEEDNSFDPLFGTRESV